jgi:hypothetical protein
MQYLCLVNVGTPNKKPVESRYKWLEGSSAAYKLKFVCPQEEWIWGEGQAMCFFAGPIQFCRWQTTDHSPDVNDDMEMFEMLGLTPQNHLQKFLSLLQLKLRALNLPLLEKTKWSRPGHTIDRILKPQLKKVNFHTYKKTHSAH